MPEVNGTANRHCCTAAQLVPSQSCAVARTSDSTARSVVLQEQRLRCRQPRIGSGAAMAQTVGDFLVERLHAWGVKRIFGYPGEGINGVFGALHRANGKIEFIQVRHEEMAAFMASAYTKFTGELGVCIATSGPGASHLVTGLYDARLDHMPVLAIIGQQARTALGGHYQQEV